MTRTFVAIAAIAALATAGLAAPTPVQARDGGAVVGGVLGGLAVGAIIGSAAAARPYAPPPPAVVYEEPEPVYVAPRRAMCVEPREIWSDRYQGYVTRNVRVPCY